MITFVVFTSPKNGNQKHLPLLRLGTHRLYKGYRPVPLVCRPQNLQLRRPLQIFFQHGKAYSV
jgi:hypothetical protein